MKKTETVKFEIDPHSNLLIRTTGRKQQLPGYRTVINGRWRVDKDNYLIYHLKKSQGSDTPQQLKLSGRWSLDKDHNLVLSLEKWNDQYAQGKLAFKGEILKAKSNRLSFAVSTKDSSGKTYLSTLNLTGRWRSDKFNQLTFKITREKRPEDKLALKGIWAVNKNNQIIYTYEKRQLVKGKKKEQTLTFSGYWELKDKRRIIYVLNKKIDSQFDFRMSLGKPDKQGLKYELGIGAVPVRKTLTLFGRWKVNKRAGLFFEMSVDESKNKRKVMFGGTCRLGEKHNLEVKLRNETGKDLGMEIKLSRKLFKGQGETFLNALASKEEVTLKAGVGLLW